MTRRPNGSIDWDATPGLDALMRELCSSLPVAEVIREVESRYDVELTVPKVAGWKQGRGVTSGLANYERNGRNAPVGTVHLNGDGYAKVKVSETGRDRWRPRATLVWEREHGPVPEGHVIVHADHDKLNDDPENLVCVPRGEVGAMNAIGLTWFDRESLEACRAMAALVSEARRRS